MQTLTSEGYGVPWAPVTEGGKVVAVIAALAGTVILALPIAVVGVTFDDEWVKQAKINKLLSFVMQAIAQAASDAQAAARDVRERPVRTQHGRGQQPLLRLWSQRAGG